MVLALAAGLIVMVSQRSTWSSSRPRCSAEHSAPSLHSFLTAASGSGWEASQSGSSSPSLGYAVEAAFLPDSSGGRAVAVILAVLLCVAVAAATNDRIPLWPLLLGTAAFTGAYEFTYNEAPPELLTTSVSTATTLLFNVAVGFLAATLVSRPGAPNQDHPHRREVPPADDRTDTKMDDFMGAEAK